MATMLDWIQPPADRVGGVVPVDLEVGSSDAVCLTITHLTAYPQGFLFHFIALTRERPGAICEEALETAREGTEDPDSLSLHFGVEFADGRRADDLTSWISIHGGDLGRPRFPASFPPDPAQEIFMLVTGSASSERSFSGNGWVWPLPSQGPLTFWVGWPAADLPVQPTGIDSALLLAAVPAGSPLWGDA